MKGKTPSVITIKYGQRETETPIETEIKRHRDRETETDSETGIKRKMETQTETEGERHRDRDRETQRQRQGARSHLLVIPGAARVGPSSEGLPGGPQRGWSLRLCRKEGHPPLPQEPRCGREQGLSPPGLQPSAPASTPARYWNPSVPLGNSLHGRESRLPPPTTANLGPDPGS